MKHDNKCEAKRAPFECYCAARTYWASASEGERREYMENCPDLANILNYAEMGR
jgi:hypothetical protein